MRLFVGLGTLLMIVSGMFLRAALRFFIVIVAVLAGIVAIMVGLWLMGFLFPWVAESLGLPDATLYDFLVRIAEDIAYNFS